ncbi:hypothetical protein PILCRDRAFT_813133 [Piloderma croceum F 1598]|uniref:Eukaryotic rRNA processing n=1 Tax=Piloderma croceum (strain F 1598) TaxID=765440 RepID=A0A0C3GBV1_PILCF|nr:hypothetical protein PILCRDRAFT_813133 [Piloderma croceum F 1598]
MDWMSLSRRNCKCWVVRVMRDGRQTRQPAKEKSARVVRSMKTTEKTIVMRRSRTLTVKKLLEIRMTTTKRRRKNATLLWTMWTIRWTRMLFLVALERIRDTIQLDPSLPWTETLAVSYSETIDADVDDDLKRELAFYKQALHSADKARSLAAKHNFPFTRPSDYFAEMVKSDSHMERIRQRLLDESAGIKKGEEKRREREGKKFGKQVQIEKIKERDKSKKDMEERLKSLKRKRKGALDNVQADDEGFDVAVEDAISDHPAKRGKGVGGNKISRTSRDKKFGFGGAGKRSKQNDRASTDNFESGHGKGGRGGFRGRGRGGGRGGTRGGRGGGSKRPGKDKRMTARSRT